MTFSLLSKWFDNDNKVENVYQNKYILKLFIKYFLSMCGLLLKIKWSAWAAIWCSVISYANSRSPEDARQVLSSVMLSISAVVMSYLQNPSALSLDKMS